MRSKKNNKGSSFQRMPGYKQNNNGNGGNGSRGKLWAWVIGIIVLTVGIVGGSWFYVNIIRELPEVSEIEKFTFKEATTITDRNGEVLYRLFEENREYISYDQISENFVNALVATEDQRFWENPGVDWKGTLRAGITDVFQGKTHGGSTLTQQIIKNILLTPEKKIERKLKEIILAMKLNSYIKDNLEDKFNNLSEEELDTKAKEKVIEIYSNLVFLGNNAYGVETASRTYFDKPASDLSILEAAILAGLPQQPSRFNPYTNRALVMGELIVTDTGGTPADLTEGLEEAIYDRIESSIDNANFTFKRDDTAILDFFRGLLSFKIGYEGQNYQVNYSTGRKDIVLSRMYEEGYITENEFKNHFFDGFNYEFNRGQIEIKAPHFVFWIRELLEEQYDPEFLLKEGLTIKTSLDYETQQMAEEAIDENEERLLTYSAGNAAMLYLDSQNGDVLAYVGSKDYNNDNIDGQVDVIQSKRQPGSSIKPLLYALGFMKLPLTIDSPIYDIETTLANNTPENADGSYTGLTSIKRALAGSRNIPAIKMFLAVGGENPFKEFLYSLGVRSLTMDQQVYGYPLAIGAGEMTMQELAQAYAHLSAMGRPAEINPIMEIRGSDGSILYQKETERIDQEIPEGVAYLIWDILSDKTNLPPGWINTLSYPNIVFASKSGTTNVVKGNDKLPRDGWLVNYTPNKVMINWAGNTDGSALRRDAYGGSLNSPIWKSFVSKLEESGKIQSSRPQQVEVKSTAISMISGKLASAETPLLFTKQSLGYINTLPTQVDDNIEKIEIDTLCNKLPSELTPRSEIKEAFYIDPESILPSRRDQEDIMEWREEKGKQKYKEEENAIILLEKPTETCEERELIQEQGEISISVVQPKEGQEVTRSFTLRHQSKSPFKVTELRLFIGNVELATLTYNKPETVTDISTVTIPQEVPLGDYKLKAVVYDDKGYSDSKTIDISLVEEDTQPPTLLEDRIKITENEGVYEVVLVFSDQASVVNGGSITRGEETLQEINDEIVIFTIDSLDEISFTVSDAKGNESSGTINLSDY